MHRILACLSILVAASGCSILFGPDEPDVTISLSAGDDVERAMALDVGLGGRVFRVEANSSSPPMTARAPDVGAHTVRVELVEVPDEVLATAQFSQTFQEDYDHWIAGIVGVYRPVGHCIGELIVVPLEPAGSQTEPDTLFLMHGGIPRDAVC